MDPVQLPKEALSALPRVSPTGHQVEPLNLESSSKPQFVSEWMLDALTGNAIRNQIGPCARERHLSTATSRRTCRPPPVRRADCSSSSVNSGVADHPCLRGTTAFRYGLVKVNGSPQCLRTTSRLTELSSTRETIVGRPSARPASRTSPRLCGQRSVRCAAAYTYRTNPRARGRWEVQAAE